MSPLHVIHHDTDHLADQTVEYVRDTVEMNEILQPADHSTCKSRVNTEGGENQIDQGCPYNEKGN